jgi:hypothetical protein
MNEENKNENVQVVQVASLGEVVKSAATDFIAFVIVALLYGYILMSIWNGIAPATFPGVNPIGYWQGVGIFVFFRLLIGRISE